MPDFTPLWSPVQIGSTKLANRVALAPMTRVSATEYRASAPAIGEGGPSLAALAKAALANRNWPHRVRNGQPFDALNHGHFAPVADVKDWELELPA